MGRMELISPWPYLSPLSAEVARATRTGENTVCGALSADWLPALCPNSYLRILLYGELEQAGSHLLCHSDTHHRGLWRLCAR